MSSDTSDFAPVPVLSSGELPMSALTTTLTLDRVSSGHVGDRLVRAVPLRNHGSPLRRGGGRRLDDSPTGSTERARGQRTFQPCRPRCRGGGRRLRCRLDVHAAVTSDTV